MATRVSCRVPDWITPMLAKADGGQRRSRGPANGWAVQQREIGLAGDDLSEHDGQTTGARPVELVRHSRHDSDASGNGCLVPAAVRRRGHPRHDDSEGGRGSEIGQARVFVAQIGYQPPP
jgi:hypothetical protein